MKNKESIQIDNITCEICGKLAFEGPDTETCWDIKTDGKTRRKQIYHQRCLDAQEHTD